MNSPDILGINLKFDDMKKLTLNNFVDQKRPVSHIMYAVISALSVTFTLLKNNHLLPFSEIFLIFLVGFLQLEVFIFAARMIFAGKEYQPSTTGKDFMRTMLVRFLVFITLCFVAALVLMLLCWIALGYLRGHGPDVAITEFFEYEFSGWFRATLGGLSFGAVIFIMIQWQDALKREQKLREENLVFQNETLRSQVNPHFLFNSLNTISSLIQTDPGRADQFVGNLASVYRYILENGQKDRVPIQSELELTNRYFDLHRVRDEDKITLNIDYTGADSYQILPVSLLILIENAIKHNAATREMPLSISVFFEEQNLVVRNNLQRKASQSRSTGIGLKNLAERISLISGRQLVIDETNDYFTVKMPLLK
jgi:sensor histidine kinase YesM